MTIQPTPFEILRAIQDQQAVVLASQRATDRLVTMLAGMLDKSAPDPLMAPGPMLAAPAPAPWQPPQKPQSNRPMRRVEIGGVPVMLSETRAKMIEAMAERPRTTSDIVDLGLAKTADSVRKAFVATNFEFTRLGIAHRIKPIERLSRVGPRGGSILPRYALVDPTCPAAAEPVAAAADCADTTAQEAADTQKPDEPASADPGTLVIGIVDGPDRALDLWSTTDMLPGEVARRLLISRTTVNSYLTAARAALDPRVIAGDSRRAPIPRSDDLPPLSVVPASTPAVAKRPPAAPLECKPIPKTAAPPPPRTGALPIEPGDLLAVDVKQMRIQTKAGSYEVGGVNLARALDFMKAGHLFGLDVIAKKAGWPTADVAKTALGFEKNRLAQHGVDLWMDKFNARLREVA